MHICWQLRDIANIYETTLGQVRLASEEFRSLLDVLFLLPHPRLDELPSPKPYLLAALSIPRDEDQNLLRQLKLRSNLLRQVPGCHCLILVNIEGKVELVTPLLGNSFQSTGMWIFAYLDSLLDERDLF